MEGFNYPPIAPGRASRHGRIRLLGLEPYDGLLTVSLSSASLAEKPYYEAISYTWGNVIKRREVKCDGRVATVPENLYKALRHLRCVDRVRTLWVDGICIDQGDALEKSAQIRMMPEIFETAQTVLVWIGKADDQTERAFSEARRLAAAQRASCREPAGLILSPGGADLGSPTDPISKVLSSIFRREWFKRIWVIQEVSVCRKVTVVCGPFHIDWDDLMTGLFTVAVPGRVVDGWRKASYAIFEQRKQYDKSNKPHVSLLIVRHQDSMATKSEDKIYALLGLADEVSRHEVAVSYDTTIEDVYQRVALWCLSHDQNLSILGSMQASSRSTLIDLPSWVPDWSVPRMAYALTFHDEFSSTSATYTAARETRYVWKQPQSERGLVLSGFQFDRIIDVGYADKTNIHVTAITKCQNLKPGRIKLLSLLSCERVARLRSQKRTYVTGEDLLNVYWQTLCAGCTPEAFNTVREEFLSFDGVMQSLSVLHKLHLSSSSLVLRFAMYSYFFQEVVFPKFGIKRPLKWYGFDDRMVFRMGRRMARTSEGYIGLVPAKTKPGDYVWLFKGGDVPFIIREVNGTMRLVGEAYIHGIMQGEAFDEGKCENVEVT